MPSFFVHIQDSSIPSRGDLKVPNAICCLYTGPARDVLPAKTLRRGERGGRKKRIWSYPPSKVDRDDIESGLTCRTRRGISLSPKHRWYTKPNSNRAD